jgi:hypothetical protein
VLSKQTRISLNVGVESAYQLLLSPERTRRSAIADLPSGISVGRDKIGKSSIGVSVGTRFTGGKRVEMHFPTLGQGKKMNFR